MAMTMDEQVLQQEDRFFVQLQRGQEITVVPWEDEPFLATRIFLVDPESAAGQGTVAACVEIGAQKYMLAQLSSDMTAVELETPVVLDEEFCLYVTRPGSGDLDADADTDDDALVVQFEGFVLWPETDEESEEEDEEEEEESSEDDDESIDEDDEESDAEVDGDVARATSPGGKACKDV